MKIPFAPPFIDQNVEDEVLDTLRSGWITTGAKVEKLQNLLSEYCGVEHTLCVNSATSGLMLALHWFGVGKGDEVILPAYTYASTALSVLHLGARPIIVDVDDDFCISPNEIEKHLSSKTKAIIPVDFAGMPCNYSEIFRILEKNNSFDPKNKNQELLGRPLLLADSAHSLGADQNNKRTGSLADISVFSFQAVKNITTGEGGAICLNLPKGLSNSDIYKLLKLWSLNGQTLDGFTKSTLGEWKYDIIYPGFKINMPDLNASIALAQLKSYNSQLLPKRLEIYNNYNKAFNEYHWAITPKIIIDDRKGCGHLYPLRISYIGENERNEIIHMLGKIGISVNVHFIPLTMFSVFTELGYTIKDTPKAYDLFCNEISLPIYPQLSQDEISFIIKNVIEAVESILEK